MNEETWTKLETPPLEPDLVSPWRRNEWLYGLRVPFSLVLVHSYLGFGLTWGAIPFVAAYFIQSGSSSLLVLAVAVFVGISVVMMHHLAIMNRESPGWKDALYLLGLSRYSVYLIALIAVLGRVLGI